MVSVEEKERLAKIRKEITLGADETRKAVAEFKRLFASVGANRMDNVSIIFNNKLSEVLHEFYKYDLELFNKRFLSKIVFAYLIDSYTNCVTIMQELELYISSNKIFSPTADPYAGSLIDDYCNISDSIFEFDLYRDLNKAIFSYTTSSAVDDGIVIDRDKAMEDMIPDLKVLGIDPEPLKEFFFNPKEFPSVVSDPSITIRI